MCFPVRLAIEAPPRRVIPVVAHALRAGSENGWRLVVRGRSVLWRPTGGARAPLPVSFRLEPGETAEWSELRVECLQEGDCNGSRERALQPLVRALQQQGIATAAVVESDTPPPFPPALFVAPQSPPYPALKRHLRGVLHRFGLDLRDLRVEERALGRMSATLAGAPLVLAAWESSLGRRALSQAALQDRPAIALAPEEVDTAEWSGPVVPYLTGKQEFLESLSTALALYFDEQGHAEEREQEALEETPGAPPEAGLLAERQRIYREVALDPAIPAEQRFHAARVLAESGDPQTGAGVLAQIIQSREPNGLAEEALGLLGTLGAVARPALWSLDAHTLGPRRAVEIARQLARAGDQQVALFRLEQLAQHEEQGVRAAALDALGEIGEPATPRFLSLATRAREPQLRLEAAGWLQQRGVAAEQVLQTVIHLAAHGDEPGITQAAVELLGRLEGEAAHEALQNIAQHSTSADARLAAAEVLNRQGDTGTARVVLLTLAQGTDDLAAGAALDLLVNVSDKAAVDTEQLMNTATLKSVRRRAAEMLSQPHQPEAVQQASARVFMALDYPALARPVLARLAGKAENPPIRRWAARQLATLGQPALEEIRAAFGQADDPVAGHSLAEALLSHSRLPEDVRLAATWLAEHSNLPRAVEVLGDLALSARVSASDAVRATNDLSRYAGQWAGAARALATLATDSPHPAVRARALDLLLREHPSELPLSLLVDLAVTGSIGAGDRAPVMEQLSSVAQPAATRIAARLTTEDVDTERRWRLLQLMNELPDNAALPALLQLSAHAPQNRIRYVAAEQLVARGHIQAGHAALATIAINAPEWILRERALYELAQALPDTERLFHSIIERTGYEDAYNLARDLLAAQQRPLVRRANRWLDNLVIQWHRWVAALPLGWVDRLTGWRRGRRE